MGNTRSIQLQDTTENAVWHWNEHIEFDIDVKDIARGARLCLGIYAVYGGKGKSKKKGNKEVSAINSGWLVHMCERKVTGLTLCMLAGKGPLGMGQSSIV
jgi:hypothetical protein